MPASAGSGVGIAASGGGVGAGRGEGAAAVGGGAACCGGEAVGPAAGTGAVVPLTWVAAMPMAHRLAGRGSGQRGGGSEPHKGLDRAPMRQSVYILLGILSLVAERLKPARAAQRRLAIQPWLKRNWTPGWLHMRMRAAERTTVALLAALNVPQHFPPDASTSTFRETFLSPKTPLERGLEWYLGLYRWREAGPEMARQRSNLKGSVDECKVLEICRAAHDAAPAFRITDRRRSGALPSPELE